MILSFTQSNSRRKQFLAQHLGEFLLRFNYSLAFYFASDVSFSRHLHVSSFYVDV